MNKSERKELKKRIMKTLKKIASVGTGVAMLGATLTGAMA